ncbi:MAG: 5-(carboxyamino)imidazole ribonucleotide synthase [Planctomycetota bacterium]
MPRIPQTLLPGAILGMLGGGQLGRMFALAARPFGFRVATCGDADDSPGAQVSDFSFPGNFTDFDQLARFARTVSVVTYEQENIPLAAVEYLENLVPVFPGSQLLRAAQNRLLEKSAVRSIGIPTADFLAVSSAAELDAGLQTLGGDGILKTITMGYDGKGQVRVRHGDDTLAAWNSLGVSTAILEKRIDFSFEMSLVGARFADRSCHFFAPTVNTHVNHILDVSVCPSPLITATLAEQARQITRSILEHFSVIGVLCVEFFAVSDTTLLVNEIAPRPHNSGHWTIEACRSSQFQQQFRAVAGLPSGDTTSDAAAVMVNLLGDHLQQLTTDRWKSALAIPSSAIHLYGKEEARRGRKMGHITALGKDAIETEQRARHIRRLLGHEGH